MYNVAMCAAVVLNCAHFDKYSGGSPTMAEEDFARILLKHTTWDLEPVFQRLRARSPSRVRAD